MKLRVLIVEDSSDDALLTVDALREAGIEPVQSCVDEPDAMADALQRGTWDVVICDYSMPRFSAREALRILRSHDADIPFIVVSGTAGESVAVEMMRAGAQDYITRDHLARLPPVVEREVRDARARRTARDAESALEAMEQRLRATFEHSPLGVVNIALDGRFLEVNPRFCEMTAYSRAELMAMTFWELVHPEDRDLEHAGLMKRGVAREYRAEQRFLRKDGAPIWFSLSVAPVREGGRILYYAVVLEDVTGRKATEAALRSSEQRYREIVETAQEGVWVIDQENRTTFTNRKMAGMLGYSVDEMMGRPMFDFMSAEQQAIAAKNVERRRSGIAEEHDFVLRRKDGGEVWARLSTAPLHDANGRYVGALAMVTDVTLRRAAEEALRRREAQLAEAQRIAHIGSWEFDVATAEVTWSDELYRIFGLEPQSVPVTYERFLAAVVEGDRDRVSAAVSAAIATGDSMDFEYRISRADGEERVLYTWARVVRDESDRTLRLLGVAQDVTERTKLAHNIQLLLDSTTEGIYGTDRYGRCTFINRAAAELAGYRPDELIGRDMHETMHGRREDGTPFPREECPMIAAAELGVTTGAGETVFWKRDGSSFPVSYASSPIIDGSNVAGAVVVFSDLSSRKMLEEQLAQADRLSSLGRVAATIAHEFNNVLMAIQPFAEILARRSGDETTARATQHILQAVQRGRHITHEILRFTRPAEPAKSTLDVAHWLPSVAEELRAVLPLNVDLEVELQGERLLVSADAQQLEQIVTNLVLNARDAMPEGGKLVIFVERCVSGYVGPFGALPTADMYAHFRVRDTGTGMQPETLKHIFEPLFTTKQRGTGLGLAVVHQIVRMHGGSIFAESTPGRGTVFHVFLPLAEEAFAGMEMATQPRRETRAGLPRRVLLIEDDAPIAAGVAALLEAEGILVSVADRGSAALAMLERDGADLVVLDLGLPDLDGRDVYERIRKMKPDLPVIFATGHGASADLEPYIGHPGVRVLVKPYDSDALLQTLEAAVANQQRIE